MISVAMEMQQWVPFALLSRYKIFRTAVNNINVLKSLCKAPDIFVWFLPKFEVYGQISVKAFSIKFHKKKHPSSGSRADTHGQTWRNQ
jgi:hypothetical protein